MPRAIVFEVTGDTGHFTPLQLQPRAVLALAFNGLAHWLRQHLVSFPRLIAEHRCSVVILGAGIIYEAPLGFFDGDGFSVRATLKVLRQASRALLEVQIAGTGRSDGTGIGAGRAVSARVLLCPVRIDDPASLAASPAPFEARLLERFEADEIDPASPPRPLVGLQDEIARAGGPALVTARHPFVVERHLCEVADQWAFFEVPGLIGGGREAMALRQAGEIPVLQQALAQPLRRVEIELQRPYFWFQTGLVESTAHQIDGRLVMVHRLLSDVPGGEQHGVAIETF